MNKIAFPSTEVTKKISYGLLALAIIFISFLDYLIVMRLQLKTISSLGQKASGFGKDIKETHSNIGKMDQLKAEVVRLEEKIGKNEKSILPTPDMVMIADYVSSLAAQYDIAISQVVPVKELETKGSKSDQGQYAGVPISIQAEGGYHNIGLFFSSLEHGEKLMNIESFEISRNPRTTKKHLLTMVVMVFVLKKD